MSGLIVFFCVIEIEMEEQLDTRGITEAHASTAVQKHNIDKGNQCCTSNCIYHENYLFCS